MKKLSLILAVVCGVSVGYVDSEARGNTNFIINYNITPGQGTGMDQIIYYNPGTNQLEQQIIFRN